MEQGVLSAGAIIGRRYRLLERLGRGGFGDVWLADELLPDGMPFRQVALKLLVSRFHQADWAEEAKLLASLRHPALVTIFAAGLLEEEARDVPFVAMERLVGSTLSDVCDARGPLPYRRVLDWLTPVADALDYIHGRGVVHLDLKPANLFLTTDGFVKVLDFGISRRSETPISVRGAPMVVAGTASGIERTLPQGQSPHAGVAFGDTVPSDGPPFGASVSTSEPDDDPYDVLGQTRAASPVGAAAEPLRLGGTPGYVAPEVLDARMPTWAADAFALGVCLVQLATGRLPYAAEPAVDWQDPDSVKSWWERLRDATVRGELRDLGNEGLPAGLVELAYELLRVSPSERGTRGGLGDRLRRVCNNPHGLRVRPARGLAPLEVADEGFCPGREDEIARLTFELATQSVLVLVGPRGVGKTSMVRAGLVPSLGWAHPDGKDDMALSEIDASDVHASLGGALRRWLEAPDEPWPLLDAPVAPDAPPAEASLDAEGDAVSSEGARQGWQEVRRRAAAAPTGVVLLFDGMLPSDGLAAQLLGELSREPIAGLRLVVTLDAAHGDALDFGDGEASRWLRRGVRLVDGPGASAAEAIAFSAATRAGVAVEAGESVERAIRFELRQASTRLGLISLALDAWWQAGLARDSPRLTGGDFDALGGVVGVVASRADERLTELDPAKADDALEWLLRFSSSEGEPRALRLTEVATADGELPEAVDWLLDQSILRREGDVLELVHPGLLSSWERLVSARLQALDRIAYIERLREAAAAWDRAEQPKTFLWSSDALAPGKRNPDWVSPSLLTDAEGRFWSASARQHARRMRLRWLAGAVLLLVVVGLGFGRAELERRREHAEEQAAAARREAAVADALAEARKADDPYVRLAWLGEALALGEDSLKTSLELGAVSQHLPVARFLADDVVEESRFPWDDRWLVGRTPRGTLVLIDFRSPKLVDLSEVDLDAEFLPDEAASVPHTTVLAPHDAPLAQVMPLAFDTAIVTRALDGEVKVWRLRPQGDVRLAAIAPMRCSGAVRAARRAPVLACASGDGVRVWTIGESSVVQAEASGEVLDVAPDGSSVVTGFGRDLTLVTVESETSTAFRTEQPVLVARFSPRDPVLALVMPGSVRAVSLSALDDPLFETTSLVAPAEARFHPGGLDLAVCSASRRGHWIYLRPGARDEADARPRQPPCRGEGTERPEPLSPSELATLLARSPLAAHSGPGGYDLPDGRVLAPTMVLFGARQEAAPLLFRPRTSKGELADEVVEVAGLVRLTTGSVALEIDGEVRLFSETGGYEQTRRGALLGTCSDGTVLAYRQGDSAGMAVVETLPSGAVRGQFPLEKALVIGPSADCASVLVQHLDGAIVAHDLADGSAAPQPVFEASGYVYRVASTPERLAVAVGDGAILEIDAEGARVIARAIPRATSLTYADRELYFTDATGLYHAGTSTEATKRVSDVQDRLPWEALHVDAQAGEALVLNPERASVISLETGIEQLTVRVDGFDRLSRWDDRGSVVAWSLSTDGPAEALLMPRGDLARDAAASYSNLRIEGGLLRRTVPEP